MYNGLICCSKCGSSNLQKGDCGYSSFNVAWVCCLDCKQEVKQNCSDDATGAWNTTQKRLLQSILYDKVDRQVKKVISTARSAVKFISSQFPFRNQEGLEKIKVELKKLDRLKKTEIKIQMAKKKST